MPRTILFFADGTWQSADQKYPSNVVRLFSALGGSNISGGDTDPEQERVLAVNDAPVQIARYIHGVGADSNFLASVAGGALGVGLIAQVLRGYTFLSRRVLPGDAIVIVGFSRGAYAARTLGALVAAKGLIDADAHGMDAERTDEAGYRLAAKVWLDWQKERKFAHGVIGDVDELVADIPLFGDAAKEAPQLRAITAIRAIGVWDTVGSLGIPASALGVGHRIDALQFIDTTLSDQVQEGWHAVAADERRSDFTPTLWAVRAGVRQVAFAGAHGDCGGGGNPPGAESGLADVARRWMAEQLAGAGVALTLPDVAADAALGPRHRPEWGLPFALAGKPWRDFTGAAVELSEALHARLGQRTGVVTPVLTGSLPWRSTEIYQATALKNAGLI